MPVKPRAALVLDALPAIGGAEKVLMAALELFPDAPVYTLLYNRPAFCGTNIERRKVNTTFIERLPGAQKHYRKYLPLMPRAIEGFDLSQFDLIISFSYAVAHGVRTDNSQIHLSYTHTPMRYAWKEASQDTKEQPYAHLPDWIFNRFREWDLAAAKRVDHFAAVSQWIAGRVKTVYGRESTVIYPPVEVERFSAERERGSYFITISRLVAHKRLGLMVQAFNRLGLPLLVIGDGPQRAFLERKAGSNIHFLGFQTDPVVADLLGRARAFVCAGKEDFGIAMVEAQAAGCPVIAYGKGGALETVAENESGIFFGDLHWESLADAVNLFRQREADFHPRQISAKVQQFCKARFLEEFATFCGISEGERVKRVEPGNSP